MDQLNSQLLLPEFAVLPDESSSTDERCTGVEIEFGSLKPDEAAQIAAEVFGGTPREVSAAAWELAGSDVGKVKVYLDTTLAPEEDSWLADISIALGSKVIPVEIVTAPLPAGALPKVERLLHALRAVGGKGSKASVAYGFGLHLNPALADADAGMDLPRVTASYALLEFWLRQRDRVDLSRRLLPFVRPFPDAFVQTIAEGQGRLSVAETFDAIDAHISSRNHGLDLLPAYAALAPERFASHQASQASVSARPAYHYRLPETRLGVAAWSLHYEWTRWQLIEAIAAEEGTLAALSSLWLEHFGSGTHATDDTYTTAVTELLGERAAMAPEGGPAGSVS